MAQSTQGNTARDTDVASQPIAQCDACGLAHAESECGLQMLTACLAQRGLTQPTAADVQRWNAEEVTCMTAMAAATRAWRDSVAAFQSKPSVCSHFEQQFIAHILEAAQTWDVLPTLHFTRQLHMQPAAVAAANCNVGVWKLGVGHGLLLHWYVLSRMRLMHARSSACIQALMQYARMHYDPLEQTVAQAFQRFAEHVRSKMHDATEQTQARAYHDRILNEIAQRQQLVQLQLSGSTTTQLLNTLMDVVKMEQGMRTGGNTSDVHSAAQLTHAWQSVQSVHAALHDIRSQQQRIQLVQSIAHSNHALAVQVQAARSATLPLQEYVHGTVSLSASSADMQLIVQQCAEWFMRLQQVAQQDVAQCVHSLAGDSGWRSVWQLIRSVRPLLQACTKHEHFADLAALKARSDALDQLMQLMATYRPAHVAAAVHVHQQLCATATSAGTAPGLPATRLMQDVCGQLMCLESLLARVLSSVETMAAQDDCTEHINKHGLHAVRRVVEKQRGLQHGSHASCLSVHEQAVMLIRQAAAKENLCRLYEGWAAWI